MDGVSCHCLPKIDFTVEPFDCLCKFLENAERKNFGVLQELARDVAAKGLAAAADVAYHSLGRTEEACFGRRSP